MSEYAYKNPYPKFTYAPRQRPHPRNMPAQKQDRKGVNKQTLVKELAKMVARADRWEERETKSATDVEAFMYWSGYKSALYDLINTIEGGTETEDYHAIVVDATDWPQLEQVTEYASAGGMTPELAVRMLVNQAVTNMYRCCYGNIKCTNPHQHSLCE